jgi:hypothetical protein
MSACTICGEQHRVHRCDELYREMKPLQDPQPTGPRGQDDEDDALRLKNANHSIQNVQASVLKYCRTLYRYPRL